MQRDCLLLGDCVEVIREIPSDHFHAILTSVPYDNVKTYGMPGCWTWAKFEQLAPELLRVLRVGGVLLWQVQNQIRKNRESLTAEKQKLFFADVGFQPWQTLITRHAGLRYPTIRVKRYGWAPCYTFVLSKGALTTFNPLNDQESTPYLRRITRCLPDGRRERSNPTYCNTGFKQRNNVWLYGANQTPDMWARSHPALMHEGLCQDLIQSYTNQGDLILDPFMGAGTTGKMAILNSRHYVGIELSPEFYKMSARRVKLAERLRFHRSIAGRIG
jgi:site-specific DNA-methyltransferase (adenine-specific)